MVDTKAELVFIPAPGVGHIMSTMEIAKLLVSRDKRLSITVLIIKPPFDSGVTNYIKSLAEKITQRIQFVQLPQDEPLPKPNPESPYTFLSEFIVSHCKYVPNIIADKVSQPGSPRVSGFVLDMFCTPMIDVANEFNIPAYVFFTSNATFLGFKLFIQALCDNGNQDVSEFSNSDAKMLVPSFVKPVPTKVFPLMMQSKEGLDFVVSSARKLREAKAIMVNTFLELETHAMKSLSSDTSIPSVYAVGPLLNLDSNANQKPADVRDIIGWLDGQPPSSVVFLCFGSMGSFGEVQVKEIALGLERSGHRFLWSLRRPPPPEQKMQAPAEYEDPAAVLPEGFLERTARTGKVIGWAPQVAVLSHQAVGGFVSHCGWNSLLESLWFGVPSAVWPMHAEQQLNAFQMVEELGLAVEIKMDYKKDFFSPGGETVVVLAEEIESGIRRLMDGSGCDIRMKVKEMSEKSRAAVAEGGSSYASLGNLIQDFLEVHN